MISFRKNPVITKILYDALVILVIADIIFIGANLFLPPILMLTQTLNILIAATVVSVCMLIYCEKN